MKSILIMGGTTFVSSSLAKYLISQGYSVDILTRGLKPIDYDGFREHLTCDRKSKSEMNVVLGGRAYQYIFDISAYTREDVENLLTSIDLSTLKKYIFCSSGSVYKPSNEVVSEGFETGDNPNWGKYGMDKKEAEDFIINSEVPYAIFRPAYIYGENNNLYREAYFFDRIKNNKVIPVPFGNHIRTQFIHIEDLVKVFESAMENKNKCKIYNIVNPEVITWEVFLEKCSKIVGKAAVIKKIDVNEIKLDPRAYFPYRDVTYMLDINQLIQDELYIPKISFEEGLRRTYKWYLDQKPSVNDSRMMNVVNELVNL